MAVSAFEAARFVCERSGWRATSIVLHKILFVAQMLHLGRHGERLIDAAFESWDYGPVLPELHKKLRMFGARPIQDVFFSTRAIEESRPEAATLTEVSDHLMGMDPAKLVAITHLESGAWARNYVPGRNGLAIPDAHIIDDYRARLAAAGATPADAPDAEATSSSRR